MTIHESMFFQFNGRNCREFGIRHVSLANNLLKDPFLPGRKRIQKKIRGNPTPYLMDVEYEQLEIPLTLAFDQYFDLGKLREIATWLSTNHYAPLIFEAKQSHIYYAMVEDGSELIHNAYKQGYFDLKFLCDSPWAYSPVYSQSYDGSSNGDNGFSFKLHNPTDRPISPNLTVEMVSGQHFSLTNQSDGGKTLSVFNLANGEILHIDFEHEIFRSSLPLVNRHQNKSPDSTFFKLYPGVNHLQFFGNIKLAISYQGQLHA